jgi:hypothetical protein
MLFKPAKFTYPDIIAIAVAVAEYKVFSSNVVFKGSVQRKLIGVGKRLKDRNLFRDGVLGIIFEFQKDAILDSD